MVLTVVCVLPFKEQKTGVMDAMDLMKIRENHVLLVRLRIVKKRKVIRNYFAVNVRNIHVRELNIYIRGIQKDII